MNKRTPARRDFAALSRGQTTVDPGAGRDFASLNSGRIRLRHATTPRQASRSAGDESLRSTCEDCEYAVPAGGPTGAALICRHKADTDLLWQVVDSNGACRNFERSRELAPIDIEAALAEGAKLIPLTQGKYAIVDAEDYERLSKYKWSLSRHESTSYGQRTESHTRRQIMMHREIAEAPPHLVVDHINHNGLDNRKRNLRLCTQEQNIYNSLPRRNCSSKYKGVYLHKRSKRYHAVIGYKGKRFHLGTFKNEVDAAKAYDKKARELFGQFAYLNFPEES